MGSFILQRDLLCVEQIQIKAVFGWLSSTFFINDLFISLNVLCSDYLSETSVWLRLVVTITSVALLFLEFKRSLVLFTNFVLIFTLLYLQLREE